MAKPIFIIRVPRRHAEETIERKDAIMKKFEDYHVFFVATERQDFEFEAVNIKDLDTLTFEDFKAYILMSF